MATSAEDLDKIASRAAAAYHNMLLATIGWQEEDEAEDEHVFEEEGEEVTVPSGPPSLRVHRQKSMIPVYGAAARITGEEAAALMPIGDGNGLKWHAQILRDDYKAKPKDLDEDGELKARRPLPQARATEFFSSLVCTPDGRWIFHGVLNGWPALTTLELLSITIKKRNPMGAASIKRLWNAGDPAEPAFPTGRKKITGVRVTLRAPPWSALGWSASSLGFCFWFKRDGTLSYGEEMIRSPPQQQPRSRAQLHLRSARAARAPHGERAAQPGHHLLHPPSKPHAGRDRRRPAQIDDGRAIATENRLAPFEVQRLVAPAKDGEDGLQPENRERGGANRVDHEGCVAINLVVGGREAAVDPHVPPGAGRQMGAVKGDVHGRVQRVQQLVARTPRREDLVPCSEGHTHKEPAGHVDVCRSADQTVERRGVIPTHLAHHARALSLPCELQVGVFELLP